MRYAWLNFAALMAPRRKKPCPPLAGLQFKTYKEYEGHMNAIRKGAELGVPLEGDEYAYALEYLSFHEEWDGHRAEHGFPEAIVIELNLDVPPYRDQTDQHQIWVHYEDGEAEVFSYKLDRSIFGLDPDSPEVARRRQLRHIKLAARHIIRPLHEELKHRSGLSGALDVHHASEPFQSILFRFLRDELGVTCLSDVKVIDIDNIGTKRYSPEEVSKRWYEFHEREADLVVMTRADHQAWHSANGKDPEPDWSVLQ
jgi:hypothetical protein